MAPPQTEVAQTCNYSLLLTYLPRKDERLSRPGWLTYSGPLSGHPSAAGRAQDRESSLVKEQCSTIEASVIGVVIFRSKGQN